MEEKKNKRKEEEDEEKENEGRARKRATEDTRGTTCEARRGQGGLTVCVWSGIKEETQRLGPRRRI